MADSQIRRKFFVILADEIDNTQRTLLHELVKREAKSWWHQYANVWVVEGGDLSTWRNNCAVITPLPPASLIVLSLKETPGGRWGIAGQHAVDYSWFLNTMSGRRKLKAAEASTPTKPDGPDSDSPPWAQD